MYICDTDCTMSRNLLATVYSVVRMLTLGNLLSPAHIRYKLNMASIEEDVIDQEREDQSTDSPRPQAEVSPLRSWLEHVYTRYLSGSTLDFMKFSLRAEIPLALLERASCLLELYLLIKDHYHGDETAALSRLVYTLNLMGHKRFGRKAVREMRKYNLSEPPEHDPSSDPPKAQLYQCLAEIGRRLTDHEEYQIRRFCARALGINLRAQSLNSMVALMALLVQEQKITEENQIDLAYALTTIGADRCIDTVIAYRKRNGLPTQAYKDLKNPDFRSTSTSNTYTTYTTNLSIQGESSRGSPTSFAYVTADEDTFPSQPPPVRRGRGRVDEWVSSTIREQPEDQTDQVDEHSPLLAAQRGRSVGRCTCVLVTTLAVLGVLLMVGVAGSVYGTVNAATHQYSSESPLVYGGSIVPLAGDLLPYYLRAMDITQIDKQNLHVIDLYLVDSPCGQLNTTNASSRSTTMGRGRIENTTGWYLLPGSEIEYFVCALTNVSRIEHEVIVEVYVLDNLDAVWELVIDPSGRIDGVKVAEEFACYTNETAPRPCWSVSYRVERAGYYSLRFTINNPDLFSSMQYNYTVSVTNLTYLTPTPEHTLHRCRLTDTVIDDHCTFLFNDSSTHLPWNMNKGVCLLAKVHEVNVPPHLWTVEKQFSQVDIAYTRYSIDWLVVSAALLAVLALGLAVTVVVESFVCYRLVKGPSV